MANRRPFLLCGIFVLGLALLDQAILRLGDRLVREGKWVDRVDAPLVLDRWEVLALGNCRALVLDADWMQRQLESRLAVGGSLAGTLGSMVFNAVGALDRDSGRRLLLVLDDWILQTSRDEAAAEVERRAIWWETLSPDARAFLDRQFGTSAWKRLVRRSGLYKYQGKGFSLLKSWMGRPPPAAPAPAPAADPHAEAAPLDVARFQSQTEKNFKGSAFAVSAVTALVEYARARGVETTLVLAPLHRVRNTDAVNERISATAWLIASRAGVPLLNYLGNRTRFARRDEWWVDPGHLNPSGARQFTVALTRDLAGAWR